MKMKFAAVFMIAASALGACGGQTYTVGSAATPTFASAWSAFLASCQANPQLVSTVTFNVLPGDYPERINTNANWYIKGGTNKIVITADPTLPRPRFLTAGLYGAYILHPNTRIEHIEIVGSYFGLYQESGAANIEVNDVKVSGTTNSCMYFTEFGHSLTSNKLSDCGGSGIVLVLPNGSGTYPVGQNCNIGFNVIDGKQSSGHGIYVAQDGEVCTVYDNNVDGFRLHGGVSFEGHVHGGYAIYNHITGSNYGCLINNAATGISCNYNVIGFTNKAMNGDNLQCLREFIGNTLYFGVGTSADVVLFLNALPAPGCVTDMIDNTFISNGIGNCIHTVDTVLGKVYGNVYVNCPAPFARVNNTNYNTFADWQAAGYDTNGPRPGQQPLPWVRP